MTAADTDVAASPMLVFDIGMKCLRDVMDGTRPVPAGTLLRASRVDRWGVSAH